MLYRLAMLSGHFPELGLKWDGAKSLKTLIPECSPARYLCMITLISLALSVPVGLLCIVMGLPLPVALIFFAAMASFLIYLPQIELGKKTSEIETSLPFFLRAVGILLDIGVPFQRAVETAARGEDALEKEIRYIMAEVSRGLSLQRGFASFMRSFDSIIVKKSVSQLLSAYEIGGDGSHIRRIGDELLALEQHRLNEYAARNAVFGLLFIISSAVLPTFFLVYVVAGGFAGAHVPGNSVIAMAMLVVFPLVSTLMILLSKASMPRSAFSQEGAFDAGFMLPGAVFVAGFLFFPKMQLAALLCGTAGSLYIMARTYRNESRIEEIEKNLPDALFSVSGMPKGTKPEKIFHAMERGGHGALSSEAAKSLRQLGMNVKLDSVLEDLWVRNRSKMMKRACLMMKQMVATNSLDKLSILGEDMVRSFQVKRERARLFAMQKYTLIFGAIIIPLIIRITTTLLQGIGSLSGSGRALDALAYAITIAPAYLVIYAMVASAAIADGEGKNSTATMYFIGLAAAGLSIFYFINL